MMAGSELQEVAAQWPTILERLGRQKMSLAAYLMEAAPVGVTADTVHVGLPAFSLHLEVVSRVEHVRLVEQVLADVLGRSCAIAYTTLPEPQAGATAASPHDDLPPIVQDIVKLFDATIVKPPANPG